MIPAPMPDGLTAHSSKAALYCVDTYFREAWEDLREVTGGRAADLARGHALLLLKPDAVVRRRLLPALDWLERHGWTVVSATAVRIERRAIRAMWQYQWNTATRDRRDLADRFMVRTDSLVLVLRPPAAAALEGTADGWATSALTRVKGPSEPAGCRPGQLRYDLGTLNQQLNLVHSADEPADLVRELGICHDAAERQLVLGRMAAENDDGAAARRLAAELGARHEPAALSLADTFGALLRHVDGVAGARPEAAQLRAAVAAGLRGETVAWRDVVALAGRCGVPLTDWDVVVLGTSLLTPTLPGVVPLLPDVSVAPAPDVAPVS